MSPERRLVEFAARTGFAALPGPVVAATKHLLLWTLGTAVAGSRVPAAGPVARVALEVPGRCTVLGHAGTCAPSAAGLANGMFAKALEYEDKLWVDPTHGFCVSAAVVPAAVAAAQARGAVSGRDLLAAVAVAAELQSRMVLAVPDAIDDHRWNPSYLYASLGAAVAAAAVSGADIEAALGLAYVQAAGNRQATLESSDAVAMQLGFAVRSGIDAAALAGAGLTGPRSFLTGKLGLYPLYWADRTVELDRLTDGLGERFELLRIGFKAHPCGAVAHPAIDAVTRLVAASRIAAEDIDHIEIEGSERLWYMLGASRARTLPSTPVELRFSLPWAIACAAADGRLTLAHFTSDAAADPRYRALAARVTARDVTADGASAAVITLRDGRRLESERVHVPLGHPDNPLPDDAIRRAFTDCVEYGLGPPGTEAAHDVLNMIDDLESLPDAAALPRRLAG
jgi:2-methylcitrate dehydratase PrpD